MRRITLLVLLIAVAPFLSLWAGGSTTYYYAALKAQVSSNSSGMGKVYAGTSETAGTYSDTSSKSETQNTTTQNEKKTFYAFAQANEGYEFKGWSADEGGTDLGVDNPLTVEVNCSSEKSDNPTVKTLYATFAKAVLPAFSVTFEAPSGGTFTVDGATAPMESETQTELYEPVLAADPSSGYVFSGWYYSETKDGARSFFSTELKTTGKFLKGGYVGATFIPEGAKVVLNGQAYESLSEALEDAQIGDSVVLYRDVAIPATDSVVVGSGVTLKISSGATLTVEGTLWLDGTLVNDGTFAGSGSISVCSKLVRQSEVLRSVRVPSVANNTVSYSEVYKYRETKVGEGGKINGTKPTCTEASHVAVYCGSHAVVRYSCSAVATFLKCSVKSGTLNEIAGVSAAYTGTSIQKSVGDASGDCMYVLLADISINEDFTDGSKLNISSTIDCADFTLSQPRVLTGSNMDSTFINGTFVGSSYNNYGCQNSKINFVNCKDVYAKLKVTGDSGRYRFYDCGPKVKLDYTSDNKVTGYMILFYSGTYDSLTVGGAPGFDVRCQVYGGQYKNTAKGMNPDPEGDDCFLFNASYFAAPLEGDYYVVHEKILPVDAKVCAVMDASGEVVSKHLTLKDAIANRGNEPEIALIEPLDLDGESVEVPAGEEFVLSLGGYALTGGTIVNRGKLTVVDVSTENKSSATCDFDNYGELRVAYGQYSGVFRNRSTGTLSTYNGVFTGEISNDAGGVLQLNGGHFEVNPSTLASNIPMSGYSIQKDAAGLYCVCLMPNSTLVGGMTSFGDVRYSSTPYAHADFLLLQQHVKGGRIARSDYALENWLRLGELRTIFDVYAGRCLDATLVFDRLVPGKSLDLYAGTGEQGAIPVAFKDNSPAGFYNRLLTKTILDSGYTASKYFTAFLTEGFESVSVQVGNSLQSNNGTVCTAMIELWGGARNGAIAQTAPDIVLASVRFTIGAGSNKAMMRPDTGAATFYSTLAAAVANAATDNKTILLAADDDESVTVSKLCTIDVNGFAFTGKIEAGAGYRLVVDDDKPGVYVVEEAPRPSITVGGGSPVTVLLPESAYPEDKTTKEAREEWLNTLQSNGYLAWQNVILGLDGMVAANKVRTVAGDKPTTSKVEVRAPITARTGTGVTVKYRLMASDDGASSSFTAKAGVDDSETPSFELTSADDLSGIKFWRIDVVFSANGGEEVLPSANVMGVKAITREAGDKPVSVTWKGFDGGNLTVDRLVSAGLSKNDEIAVWDDENGTYYTWLWKGSAWEPAESTGGAANTPAASEVSLARGTAFWYKRNKGDSAGDDSFTFLQIGEHADAAIKTVTKAGTDKAPANNLLVSPWAEPVDLAQVEGAEGDRIVRLSDKQEFRFKTVGDVLRLGFEKATQNKWGGTVMSFEPVDRLELPANAGCWYISFGGHPEIAWPAPAATGTGSGN